jgi:hypothetical protein
MQCNRLVRLIKDWYLHVKEETMAPARMMQFVDKHILECETCQQDNGIQEEVEKIREFVMPEAKFPKSFRDDPEASTPEISPDDDEYDEEEISEDENEEDDPEEEEEDDFEDFLDSEDDLED